MFKKPWAKSFTNFKNLPSMQIKSIQNFSALFLLLIAASCGPQQQQVKPAPVQVTVQKISESNAVYYDEYPATVTAINQVELRAQVNGYITAIHFKEGNHVKKDNNCIPSTSNSTKPLI